MAAWTRRDLLGALVYAGMGAWRPIRRAMIDPGQSDVASPEGAYADPATRPWRRLFLDAAVVEDLAGLTRVFHSAQKHPGNPVITCDRPWEIGTAIAGPYVYGTVLWEGGRFRLWYQIIAEGQHIGYAESTDGVAWTKPNLGIIQYRGSRANNLVVSAWEPEVTGGLCHNPSVIHCPSELEPQRRYVLYGYDPGVGARAAYSPDGLHWRYPDETSRKPLFTSSDVLNFFRDTLRGRYAATWKTKNRRGRAVGVAWSTDGARWTKPIDGPVFVADDLDPDATQAYGMPVFPYQGMYIGLPWIYNARYIKLGDYSPAAMYEAQADSPRTVDVQLAWSWDLINWTRPPDRAPFIARGGRGEFDSSMIYTARAPVLVGDRLFFYYGGCRKPHDEPHDQAAIGLATLRVDGFCSLRAEAVEGWCITRRERFLRPALAINASTQANGYVLAELLDRRKRVIPGFDRSRCQPFTGDSVRHTVTWAAASFPERLTDRDLHIRFVMRGAHLFSYSVLDGVDADTPDATGGP